MEQEVNDGRMGVAADSGAGDDGGGGGDAAAPAPGSEAATQDGDTRPARADWQLPSSDQRCPTCLDFWVPTAVCVFDEGWSLEWTCGDEEKPCWGLATAQLDDLEWPFEDDEEPTSRADLEALGFIVIVV